MRSTTLERLKQYDESREGIPGEHWMALAAGVALWVGTRSLSSMPAKVAFGVLGSLLVTRALTGRDALGQRVRWLPRPH